MTILVNKSGTFRKVNKVAIRNGGTWRTVRRVWTKKSGTWRLATPEVVNSTILRSGDGVFTVPAGVLVLNVSYPTSLGIVNAKLNVTPGQSIYYSIGDYGYTSAFGPIVAPVYDREVIYWENEVDANTYIDISVATSTGTGFFGDPAGSDNTTLYNQAIAAGCYYDEYSESAHGDLYAIVRLYTGLSGTLINPGKIVVTNLNDYGRGGSGVEVLQQPTADNSYRVKVRAYDGGYSQWHQSWNLNLRQQVPFTISW